MIHAVFTKSRDVFTDVSVSGHAGYADPGGDIVCAAVTSAVQLASNGITEIVLDKAIVQSGSNKVQIKLPGEASHVSYLFMEALYLHLCLLSEEYGDYISVEIVAGL